MQSQNLYAIPGQIVTEASWRQYISDGKCTNPAGTICVVPPAGGTQNIPKFLYWSPRTQRSYELRSKGGTKITVNDLVVGVNEGGFADPEVLFDGNFNCTRAGRAGGAIVKVMEKVGEEVQVGCLSQLPMYLECGMRCPDGAVRVEGLCPFGNVTRC